MHRFLFAEVGGYGLDTLVHPTYRHIHVRTATLAHLFFAVPETLYRQGARKANGVAVSKRFSGMDAKVVEPSSPAGVPNCSVPLTGQHLLPASPLPVGHRPLHVVRRQLGVDPGGVQAGMAQVRGHQGQIPLLAVEPGTGGMVQGMRPARRPTASSARTRKRRQAAKRLGKGKIAPTGESGRGSSSTVARRWRPRPGARPGRVSGRRPGGRGSPRGMEQILPAPG